MRGRTVQGIFAQIYQTNNFKKRQTRWIEYSVHQNSRPYVLYIVQQCYAVFRMR
jgi:hypothetical protein